MGNYGGLARHRAGNQSCYDDDGDCAAEWRQGQSRAIFRDLTTRNPVPQRPRRQAAGPLRIGAAHRRCRALVGVETQIYQRRCAPSCPMPTDGHQTGTRSAIAPEPGHRGAREGSAIIARTGDNRNRHDPRDPAPIFPACELREIVRSHQPDEPLPRPTADEFAQGIDGVTGAQFALDGADANRCSSGLKAGRGEALGKHRFASAPSSANWAPVTPSIPCANLSAVGRGSGSSG